MIYFENEAATLHCFPDKNLAVAHWKGFANSENLREVLDKCVEILDKYTIYYWLSDNRNMKVIRPADQEYIATIWLGKVLEKAEIKKSASIQSEDVFNKISVENILRTAEPVIPFERKDFIRIDEAVEWLGVEVTENELHGLYKD